MDKTFQTRIKHKRDSQANWEANNPVLLDGELGIVVMSDGKIKTKVGDGVTNYNLLPFSSSDVELTWENIEGKPENFIVASDEAIEVPIVDPYVRHDREQTLTEEEKALARLNIGAANASEVISDVQEQLDSKVPNTRTVNGKALSANISLSATDIGAAAIETTTATIAASGWSSNSATISNNLITASNTIIIAPAPTSYVTWGECKIRAVTQTAGKITLQCDSAPTTSITVNLVILG